VPTSDALSLPVSARLAWWGTAWLRGLVVTDLAVDAVLGDDATHAVAGLPRIDGSVPLARGLAEVRASGAEGIGLALPVAGDPAGLGGPAAFNAAALDAGEAVVAGEVGLVPQRVGAATVWTAYDADRRPLTDVGEADRTLRLILQQAASALADLDVARWRPEAADALMDLHHAPRLRPAPGTPGRCVELAARALQARAITELALADDGGAHSASEADLRRGALQPLGDAARHALVAACSPEVWPD
jgi:hypothetical protein